MGYRYLRLGWYENAVKVYKQLIEVYPHGADMRFFLASAYASMKRTDQAITELKTILRFDPTDVLGRHDLALCFRNKGWLKESFEEMKKANEYAATYGNADEKKIIKSSLRHIEEEIGDGNEDGTKGVFLLLILLATVLKRWRVKTIKPPGEQGYINVDSGGKRYIQPDPIIAPLIRGLYGWYVTGNYSLLEVTKKAQAEGLTYRKTGPKLHKSIVHKILTNPIYYGDFDWAGRRYRGNHEPIVSKELFGRVQDVLAEKGRRRTRQQKHKWTFQGLVSCGHCGCALTGEIKKGRYVYYHCTGHKGKCPEHYIREEELDREFTNALRAIKIDKEVVVWIVKALKESHSEEKRYHNGMISTLQNQYQKLQDRIDAMYVDKLEGKISEAFFTRKREEWGAEQADILRKIEQHHNANRSYFEEGTRLLELAQQAVTLYEKQEMEEKRRLLNFVFSNSTWKDGKLIPAYRKPFDLLALTNTAYQKEKAVSSKKDGLFEIWLPGATEAGHWEVSLSL